jgi:Flp pilus assembly pilin Flp
MKTHKGVSLTEYGLMAGTISLIVVPALFLLGQKLAQSTSEMLYYEKTPQSLVVIV